VRVFDSLKDGPNGEEIPLSNDLKKQLKELYSMDGGYIEIERMKCQQQLNHSDCGVFVIAFATEILLGEEDAQNVKFDRSKMRKHLKQCLIDEKLTPFPKERIQNDIVSIGESCWSKLDNLSKRSLGPRKCLEDEVLDTVSLMLKKGNPALGHTLKEVFHCNKGEPFKFIDQRLESLQFHNVNRNHWVLTTTIGGGQLRIYDSLRTSPISLDLKRQLTQLYP
jgi:hypothetical protein